MVVKKKKLSVMLRALPFLAVSVAANSQQLEEVIVTAQKVSASTQDTPIAITGMSEGALEKFGFSNANDIVAQVPNMQVSGPYGEVQPIFAIRGVSMSDYSSNQASPIGVYADEAYMGAVYTHGMSFFDVERLEVLRGPQGTLYGKNTTGGAINIVTKTPMIGDDFTFSLKQGLRNYNGHTGDYGVQGTVIEDVMAARLFYSYSRRDGFYENQLGGPDLSQQDFQAARLVLNFNLSDKTNMVLKYTTGRNDSLASPARSEPRGDLSKNPGLVTALSATGVGTSSHPNNGFIDNTGYSRPAQNLGRFEVQDNGTGELIVESDMLVNKIEYIDDAYTLTAITSFADSSYSQLQDVDGGPDSLLHINWGVDTQAFSQDFRFSTTFADDFDLIAGAYYATEDMQLHNVYSIYETPPDTRVAATYPQLTGYYPYLLDFGSVDHKMDTEKTSYAAYSQLRWNISARLGMDIGIRYTHDRVKLTYLNASRVGYDGSPRGTYTPGNTTGVDNIFVPVNVAGQSPLELGELLNGLLSGRIGLDDILLTTQTGYTHGAYTQDSVEPQEANEREWTGKIGLDYRFSDDLMVYGAFSRGFRAGSFNAGVYYEEREFDDAYAAPEYIDAYEVGMKSDLFDQRVRINAAAFYYDYTNQQFINVVGVSNFLENAGGSTIYGLESEMAFAVTEALTIQVGIGLLKSEYTELVLANVETINNDDDFVDLAGNELISAPQISMNMSIDYELFATDTGYMSMNLNGNYQSEQWFSAYNDKNGYENIRQDAYALVNGRLSWYSNDGSYTVALWGKNLMETEYDGYAINLQGTFGFDYYQQGSPRTYGLEMSYRY
ncbi:Colicin I receptor [Zhongshania aliphaticivorans]|uniref:Colicin I receptor n=1 Tax=Zhongshania aliphaticivorans TaxID=1470434 RepID=A0A5S9QL44_9GAMM|nr:TonB-dependent receptor [Zhongshania aliphaticivorans]CAA0111436.1 Colicin I receptor [Zhongshania aliphaticivorans]CAA0118629.1 Colicin I receptor [Zhongshania aliphaticivorans]